MKFTIRPLQASEIDYLKEMFYKAIFVPEGNTPPQKSIILRPELKKYFEDWGRKYDRAMVAEEADKRIGIAWIRLFSHANKGYGFVDENTPEISMVVNPECRNQGVGTQLLRSIFNEASSMGLKKISLSTDKRNRAVKLYLREGFKIFKENEIDFIMIRNLASE